MSKKDHIVEIRRIPNPTRLPNDYFLQQKETIGSFYAPNGAIGSGLTNEEIKLLMPEMVHLPAEDLKFREAVNRYFRDISVRLLPFAHNDRGVELNIATDKNGVPVNPKDYILYKFCVAHPDVANKKSEISADSRAFIYDAQAGKAERKAQRDIVDKALAEYLNIKNDENKVRVVLTAMGEYYEALRQDDDLIEVLETITRENPQRLIAVLSDKNLEMTSFIYDCINFEILRKVGQDVLYKDENLGDMEEACLYLKKAENSELLQSLKAAVKHQTEEV